MDARADRLAHGASRAGAARGWIVLATGAAALLVLFFACRGAPLGVPAADDYTFLATLRFEHPLDLLGPMGSPYYWRPLSRQIGFTLLGPWLMDAPWVVVAVHAVLLFLLFVVIYRVARRGFEPRVAAAIAAFPLLAEPTRVLLAWPTGNEYLLAMLGCGLALHEALAGRLVSTGLAAGVAIMSHEAGHLVLPALPLVAWLRTRRLRAVLPWGVLALGLALGSWIAHGLARTRGMTFPSDAHRGLDQWRLLPETFVRALAAQLNLEDLSGPPRIAVLAACAALLVAALALAARPAVRARLRHAAPALMLAAAWFVLGVVPLTLLLPDWNGWRTVFPGLGLGFVLVGGLGLCSPWLAIAFAALRALTLCLALAAPAQVEVRPPRTDSSLSFARLVRIQRTVESTRRALLARYPALPRGATVEYWLAPALTLYGFQDARALRVWYGDASLEWQPYPGLGQVERAPDALVEYSAPRAEPATVIEPEAVRHLTDALEAAEAGRFRRADSLLSGAFRAQPRISEPFYASVAGVQARVALALGEPARADSLNQLDLRWAGESVRHSLVEARLAAARGDLEGARRALQRVLALEPGNPEAAELARGLGLVPGGPAPGAAPGAHP